MKYSQLYAPTLKEVPKDAETASHRLLLRAGYIRKLGAGIYDYLPLGLRVLRRVESIVREEMDRAGAQEVLLPAVQPAEIWKESGRWEYYGAELLRMKDRKGGDFCLGPTHEEVITDLVRGELRSYRSLPVCLYQVQTKFRDELRPRAGLLRGREFIMKDAYSFDADEEGARASYQRMYDAYVRVFTRCGLDFRPVEADTGNIGGNLSHEFQVLADSGEDAIVSCPSCGYTANVEKAALQVDVDAPQAESTNELKEVATPGTTTCEAVASLLGVPLSTTVRTLVLEVDGELVAVLMRGDREFNDVKLKILLGATTVDMAPPEKVALLAGAPVGFVGPVGLRAKIYADHEVRAIASGVVGANRVDAHLTGFNAGRDCGEVTWGDFRLAGAGDPCGRCGGTFEAYRGIEVGQVFYLGTKYSAPMQANYLNAEGQDLPLAMGCYGIGVSRTMAAAVEQNHDEDGIVWPMGLAPYHVIVLPMSLKEEPVIGEAERVWRELRAAGIDAILDDRDLRPGVKFKDADLLGVPLRVTVGGRGLEAGTVEVRDRRMKETDHVGVGEVVATLIARVRAGLAHGHDA